MLLMLLLLLLVLVLIVMHRTPRIKNCLVLL